MYLKMMNVDRFVKMNGLEEITNPAYLQFKHPTPDGLFSTEIFGVTQEDRSTVWAYIDLGSRFLHPLAAINFKRYSSVIENIISGTKYYKFVNGEFIEDPENGDTGIDFLYEHYDEIKWRETDSRTSNERINFLKQGKDKLFITKFPVCPPFYRDINDGAQTGIPIVNELYKKVISQASALKRKSGFTFFGNNTKAVIQTTLVDIFNHYMGLLKGKFGLLRKSVMSRNVDYGVWMVLTSPVINCDRYEDMLIDFDHLGIPLPAVLAMYKPFILHYAKEYFTNIFLTSGTTVVNGVEGNKDMAIDYLDPLAYFSADMIDDRLTEFVNDYSTRFESIELPPNYQKVEGVLKMTIEVDGKTITRPMTWTDFFYQAAEEVTMNKSAMWSRYPIEYMYSVEYPKVRVLSTINTCRAKIGDHEYKWYPIVNVDKDSSSDFIATIMPSNVNIATMGADYDGDSTPVRPLYSTEANIDADKWRRSKINFLDPRGKNLRETTKDFVQLVYSLTKAPLYVTLDDPN